MLRARTKIFIISFNSRLSNEKFENFLPLLKREREIQEKIFQLRRTYSLSEQYRTTSIAERKFAQF